MTTINKNPALNTYSTSTQGNVAGTSGIAATRIDSAVPVHSPALPSASNVTISDIAKRIVEQDHRNQVALGTLNSVLQGIKANANNGGKLTSPNNSPQTLPAGGPLSMQLLEKLGQAVRAQNTDKDGRVSSYNMTINDIDLSPNTPQEVSNWYETDGASLVSGSEGVQNNPDFQEMVQAIRDKSLTFYDANDIPDLNFHNKITIVGGEGGGAPGLRSTYNNNSSIFKDPSRGYMVNPDGTVISWAKKNAAA